LNDHLGDQTRSYIFAAALAGLVAAGGAQAADLYQAGGYKDGPLVAESWTNPGDIFVRLRGLAVLPQTSTDHWNLAGTPDVSITDSAIPEVDFTYFFTKNIAAELIAGVTPHTVNATGSISAVGKVGDAWLLPPTLTLQYHFYLTPQLKPYIGGGVNYTIFFDESTGPSFSSFKLDNNWGAAVQAGFDYKLAGNWFLNFDFKKLWLETDAHATLGAATPVYAHVNIDPIIVGAGIGYHFGSGYVPLK
jgi:outer membrane protein